MAEKRVCEACGGTIHGAYCLLCELFESGTTGKAHEPKCWPMKSMAMGVHPKQIEEAMARNKRHGVNVTYDRFGRAILPDRGERKKLLRLEGYHDNNGGYGD